MSTITFDTLKFVEHLRSAGMPENQAKALSDAQKELITEVFEQQGLATKADIKELELKIELLRSESKKDIAETKAELIRWVVGAGFLQTALIAGLLLKMMK